MNRFLFPALLTLCFLRLGSVSGSASADTLGSSTAKGLLVQARSPDGHLSVSLTLVDGVPQWSLLRDGKPIWNESPLRFFAGQSQSVAMKFQTASAESSVHDSTWRPTVGLFDEIRNHYSQVDWTLAKDSDPSIVVTLRVFDDAVAIRCRPLGHSSKFSDAIQIDFAGDYTFWAANGEMPNVGPLPLSKSGGMTIQAPMTICADDDLYLSVLEAGIEHQYPFQIEPVKDSATRFELRSSPVSFPSDASTAWRVVLVESSAGDLITNSALENLSPPLAIEDPSWIKPGIAMWDWRAWGATAPDGFVYGLDMASWRRMIDFAARKKNIRYLLLDANWYGPEFLPSSDPTTSRDHLVKQNAAGEVVREPAPENWDDPIDVPALIQYAKARDVGVILYFNDHARKNFDFEKTLATYQEWGAAGIKYGFMATKGHPKVEDTLQIVRACAKHQLVCDFHDGPIPGSGDSRTYPNYLAREFCHAQADAKRSFTPETFCTTVFVNQLTGLLDMNNGLYAISDAEKDRPRIFQSIESTVVAETARVMIVASGLAIIPDIPEAYDAKADLFKFIEELPMTWDETRVVSGVIGDHITVARRSGDRWFVASACDANGVTLPLKLDFLEPGRTYTATLFEDAADAHYQTNPEAYRVRILQVNPGDTIHAKLAPGGGHAMLIE